MFVDVNWLLCSAHNTQALFREKRVLVPTPVFRPPCSDPRVLTPLPTTSDPGPAFGGSAGWSVGFFLMIKADSVDG